MAVTPETTGSRRRRAPADARQEILDAAAELLAEGEEFTVAAIMGRTTLSRKSFYVYFRDRAGLLEALVRPLRTEADVALRDWLDATDPVTAGRTALSRAAQTYRRHGAVLRAVFWAGGDDPDIRTARAALINPVIDVAEVIIARLTSAFVDPRATAEALVTMNVYRLLSLRPEASDTELDALVDTLATVWERALGLDRGENRGN